MAPWAKQNFYCKGEVHLCWPDSAVSQGPARKHPQELRNTINLSLSPFPIQEQSDMLFPSLKTQICREENIYTVGFKKKNPNPTNLKILLK